MVRNSQKRTVIVSRLPFFSAIFAFSELNLLRQLNWLQAVWVANIISLKPQVSISHFAQAKYITP